MNVDTSLLSAWAAVGAAGAAAAAAIGTVVAAAIQSKATVKAAADQAKQNRDIADAQAKLNRDIAADQAKLNREIALAQISASIISTNRQNWINEVRDTVAGFQAATIQIRYQNTMKTSNSSEERQLTVEEQHYETAHLMRSRLALLINPLEEDHAKLMSLISERLDLLPYPYLPDNKLRNEEIVLAANITKQAQKVLKREWERVKAGDPVVKA